MKLKKWGSLLTALAMVGSMATYVPASVSAAETDVLTHSGTFEFATDVAFSVTQYPETVLENNVTKPAENVLEIYAATDGATYTVPNNLLYDVAYEFKDANTVLDEAKYNTEALMQENIHRIVIKGNAVIDNANVTGSTDVFKQIAPVAANSVVTNSGKVPVQIDCRAKFEVIKSGNETKTVPITDSTYADNLAGLVDDTKATVEVTHNYEPNTTYNTHICGYCNDIDNSLEAHDFTKDGGTVDTKKGTHKCDCGKLDTDYLIKNEDGSYKTIAQCETELGSLTAADVDAIITAGVGGNVNGNSITDAIYQAAKDYKSIESYKKIHGFNEELSGATAPFTHECGVCGAYDVVQHQGSHMSYTRGATTHQLTCKDHPCGYTTTAANHTYAPYWDLEGDKKTVSDLNIEVGMHYCTVCGYVPGVTFDSNGDATAGEYTGGHTFDSKFVYQWDATANGGAGAYVKTIVTATTAAEKTVCKCGEIKDDHNHSYQNYNEHHLCYCGNEQLAHNYDYNYTITGAATVNGEKGWTSVAAGTGAACSCGKINPKHDGVDEENNDEVVTDLHINTDTEFEDVVNDSLENKNDPAYVPNTFFYTDTTTGKHYCTCGKEVVDSNNVAIHYYVNAKDEKHTCLCGKVDEKAHAYTATGAGYYEVVANAKEVLQLLFIDDETAVGDYYVVTGTAGSVVAVTGTTVSYAPATKGVYCACGKLESDHVCDFSNPLMCIDGVHYCACGKASEEHDFDSSTNKCKVCGEYVEHEHKPTSNTNCTCAVCGEPAHALVQSGTYSHKCMICAKEVTAHVYEADTTKHTHTCTICGYVAKASDNPHRYGLTGTAQCICIECGLEEHDREDGDNANTENVTEKHYCRKCATDLSDDHEFEYIYDATLGANDDVTINEVDGYREATAGIESKLAVICACGEIKTGHVCEAFANAPNTTATGTVGKADRAGVTVKVNDEYCVCGKVLSHKLGLATEDNNLAGGSSANASYHACVNTINVDKNNDGVIDSTDVNEVAPCANVAVAHNFPPSVVSGKTVYATFCTDCGAVNPEKLNRARLISDILSSVYYYNDTDKKYYAESAFTNELSGYALTCAEYNKKYIETYTTAYIVELTKNTKAVMEYDVVDSGVVATYSSTSKAWEYNPTMVGTDTTGAEYYKEAADVAKIKIAATTAEQTAFNNYLKAFNTTDANASATTSQAGGHITIEYVSASAKPTSVGATGADIAKLDATTIYGQVNSEVEVKMIVKEGYKFSGWYSDEKATTLISADQITKVKVANGEKKIYAFIEENQKVQVNLPAGVTYWSTITQKTEEPLDVNQSVNFSVGEAVYMKATSGDFLSFNNNNGNAFVYNYDSAPTTDANGDTIVDNDYDWYTFTVKYADNYTLTTKPVLTSSGEVYVVFKNSNNDRTIAAGKTSGLSAAKFEPAGPAQAGKTFVGWKDITDPNNNIVKTKAIDSALEDSTLILVPHYKNRTDLKITLENGSFLDAAQEEQNATGFEYGTPIKITAPEKNTKTGKYFSGWYNGDELVYGTRTVAHIITDTVTLTAKYEGSSELKAETSYVLSSKRNETSTGEQVVLTASWNIIEDVTVLDTGYVFTLDGASADTLKIENVNGNNVKIQKIGLKSKYAVYNFNVNLKDSTGASAKTVTAKFYVNYLDANGIEQTIYTDAVTEAPLS